MTTIRKREWVTPAGEERQAWQVDYRDAAGARRSKQFKRKRDAEAWLTTAAWEVSRGTHTPDSKSITIATAADQWLERGKREGLEPFTLAAYGQHVRLHIVPHLGAKKLNQLAKPAVEHFRDDLLDAGRSRAMVARILRSLSAIVGEAERRGYVAQNVCRGVTLKRAAREQSKVSIPSKAELAAMIAAAAKLRPIDEPMLLTLIFAGLRASELRALGWDNVDLKKATITVTRRADTANSIGSPKSAAGRRTIPVPEVVVAALRRWKLRCTPSDLDLVFPSRAGTPLYHAAQTNGFLHPVQVAAGVTEPRMKAGQPVVDEDGQTVMEGRYSLHCLRHAAASLWIEQRVSPKRVQTWIGHSSIQVTFDTYGHLFDAAEHDAAVMSAIEREVIGSGDATRMQHDA